MNLAFEWDPDKAAQKAAKHGVEFAEARTVFRDPFASVEGDPAHSSGEERFRLIGRSRLERLLVVVYTERGDRIRIISAREARGSERRNHEEGRR